MEWGARQHPRKYFEEIREAFQQESPSLPEPHKELVHPEECPAELGPNPQKVQQQIIQKIKEKELRKG